MVGMRSNTRCLHLLLLGSALLLLLLPLLATADDPAEAAAGSPGEPSQDFSKLRVKELQALLEERGVSCSGCAEKSDLVKRVQETFHLPIKPPAKPSSGKGSGGGAGAGSDKQYDDAELEELLKKMGGGKNGKGFKIFRPEDFANMNDDDMAKKFSSDFKKSQRGGKRAADSDEL